METPGEQKSSLGQVCNIKITGCRRWFFYVYGLRKKAALLPPFTLNNKKELLLYKLELLYRTALCYFDDVYTRPVTATNA
jgi:hypothetical protein